ncbi:MAG TPA: CBS domain-containing protein [Terriglobales bacterium]|nr:CBS domain-containing protein [Terriglobales bacterium]
MKVREAMTGDPVCVLATDSAQKVARQLCEHNIGSAPVVADHGSKKLIGMVTDRDLACTIVAAGLDPKSTTIERAMTREVVSCREGENLDNCQRLMREHQVRRIPIVDASASVIGILSLADVAQKEHPEKVSATVKEISKPSPENANKAA